MGGGKLLFEIGYHLLILLLIVFIWFTFTRVEKKKDEFREELRRLRSGRTRLPKKEGLKDKLKRSSRRWKKAGQMRWKWQRKRMRKEKKRRIARTK